MPLIRFHIRNEYGLGNANLHVAANKDNPKALLDGVAVSGLVGILRQLGDLVEFAAEVFNDLHEQVKATAARGHKMMIRVQHIEAELPPLEKDVMAQISPIKFAYTKGSDWYANVQIKQNHLAHRDSPRFIMESYEECRDPPHLFLLDKFDTAGAGACLKRYSDPSFFRMACTKSELMKEEEIQREKKAHKSMGKGQRQRNGEVQLAVSISKHYRRTQLAPSNTDGQSSTEIISTSDTQSKLELANPPTSYDSSPSLNCDEHVLDLNSSIGPEEQVYKELPTSRLNMQFNDMCASVLHCKQNGECAENDSPHGSLDGQSILGSPSVSQDEKTEISKPAYRQYESIPEDWCQLIEPPPVKFCQKKLEQKTASLSNVDQENGSFHVENIPESFCARKEYDEIATETDNALNTMESEIETDSECQTKQEVQLKSNLKDRGTASVTSGKHKMPSQTSDSSKGSPFSPYSTSNKETSPKFSNSATTKSSFHAQLPHITGMMSNPDCSLHSGFESVNSVQSSGSSISNPQGNEVISDLYIQEESSENSKVPSVKPWTNGMLFGVEPSKPPDFSVSNLVSQNSTSNTTNKMGDGSVGKLGGLIQPIELSTTMNSDTTKLQERPHCIEQKKEQTRTVSRTSQAPTPKEEPEFGSVEYPIPSKSCYAYHPSPPLEHMKISFHPINGLETSKMKLKFPDRHRFQGSIQDVMFPTFQLLPEHSAPLQDVASESDDDTFYRSSPYPTEDLSSLYSESNSEPWESGEATGSKDHRIHDALHRTSSTTSISSSLELEEKAYHKICGSYKFRSLDAQDDIKSFDSDFSVDLREPVTVDPLLRQQEGNFDFRPTDFPCLKLQYRNEHPPPPPLPPLQWRITKPTFALVEDKQHNIPEPGQQPNVQHVQASTIPLPPKPTQWKTHAEGICHEKSKQDQKMHNGRRQMNQAANGKVQDEREDLLLQIRTKSLNLRRTVTRRPSFVPAPATNINVVAILEKANAIRQAFASSDDDGDDENWSDD